LKLATSAASFRGGGHIVSSSGEFPNLVEQWDLKAAVEINEFALASWKCTSDAVEASSDPKIDGEFKIQKV
jgi:hypothetical protein